MQLLVVDLYKFHRESSCRGDALHIWLDVLLSRVPGCVLLVVATHGDCFNENRGEVETALSHLQAAISEYMEDKRKEWDRMAATMEATENNLDRSAQAAPSLRICGVVEASGCSADDLSRLRDRLCSLAWEGGQAVDGERLFPYIGQIVPVSWARVWVVMEALLEVADPFVAAQSIGQPVVPVEGFEKHKFVTWKQAFQTWAAVVDRLRLDTELGGSSGDGEQVFEVGDQCGLLRRVTNFITPLDISPPLSWCLLCHE